MFFYGEHTFKINSGVVVLPFLEGMEECNFYFHICIMFVLR